LREAIEALIVANHFLETELEKLRAVVSTGYARGKLLPCDRKDCTIECGQLTSVERHGIILECK
jgi:hypothetical protein